MIFNRHLKEKYIFKKTVTCWEGEETQELKMELIHFRYWSPFCLQHKMQYDL
jgi:hypothetical protein